MNNPFIQANRQRNPLLFPGLGKQNRQSLIALLFIIPSLLGFGLFYLWPFLSALGYAFTDKPIGGQFAGLDNFISLFQNKAYLMGLTNTLLLMGTGVPLNMGLALALALMIRRLKRRRDLVTLLFLIPLVIPSGSMVYFWKMFFDYNGYLNRLLAMGGLERINWLDTALVRYVVTLIFIWKNLGYNIILFLAGLSSIPQEYYEAARVDGARPRQIFRYITAPCLLPTLFIVTIMSIINSFKIFKEVYLITGSYPHESIYLLQHFMNNMFQSLHYPKLATATCFLVLIITIATQLLFRLEKKVSL